VVIPAPFLNRMTKTPIPYTDFGGNGPPLHFLHANGYPPACYTPLIEHLKKDFHITGMHLRPLWSDEKPEELADWNPLADDFLQFLSYHENTPVIGVGHSVGGIVALRAALLEPHRFRALVLLDPVLFPPYLILIWNLLRTLKIGWKIHPSISGALGRRRKFDNLDIVFQGYRQREVFRNFSDESLRTYIKEMTRPVPNGGYELIYSPEWEAQIYYNGVWRDLEVWQGLKTLNLPTLIIRGGRSNTFWRNTAAHVKRINPVIRLETIELAGHLVPLEFPQEVAGMILSFSKELS
jgi:pimeloyl-ACP methyl ester carboxylesterase